MLLDLPVDRRARRAIGLVLTVLVLSTLQAVHGVRSGADAGTAGAELRVLLGFGAAVIALPLLRDPATRARLFGGLVAVGLAIGLWGIAQWVVDIPFTSAQDAGVREGVRFTAAGRGQIQGGLFAFPVAIVMGTAALLFARGPPARPARAPRGDRGAQRRRPAADVRTDLLGGDGARVGRPRAARRRPQRSAP